MAQASTIKDFLVALGFKTDNAGLAKMQGAMQGVELKAKSLNAALGALAVGAVLAVRQTASELDKLYFSSKRIGASAENINAYGNAIAQMGGSAEDAIGTLESLAEKMRNSPGYEGMLNSLGVSTKDANGALRDRVEVMKDLSATLAKMPSYQANAYASSLGIDQKTLLAMRDDKFIGNMEKYQKIQKELGMNDELTKSGNDFMTQYRDLSMITKTGFQVIVMQVGKALIPVMKGLNQLVLMGVHTFSQMNPQIKNILVVGLRFALLSAVFSTVTRTLGLFLRLAAPLKGFIRLLGLLRLAFLATPIGIITALGAAILALYNDYKTWKEGGKSFLDWSQWSKEIDWVSQKIRDFMDLLEKITGKTIEFVQKLIKDPEGTITGVVKDAVEKAKEVAKAAPAVVKEAAKNVVAVAGVTTNGVKGLASMSNDIDSVLAKFNITGNSKIGFLANIEHETGSGKSLVENTNYSWKSFSKLAPDVKNIRQWIGSKGKNAKEEFSKLTQPQIMEIMYGNRKNLGNTQDGDGYKFRGRGYMQLTGRAQYQAFADAIGRPDTMKNPDLIATDKNLALMSAAWFWQSYSKAGKQATNGDFRGARQTVNGGNVGMVDVMRLVDKYQKNESELNGKNNSSGSLIPKIRNVSPPNGNPNKSQTNSSLSNTQSNVTIHQSFKTDMTINGASNPQESANAVKRQQENSLAIARRNVQSITV